MDLQKLLRIAKKICFLPPIPTLLIAVPAFTGNSNADTVWSSKGCGFQTAYVSDYRHWSVYGRSWNGCLYDYSDNNTDKKM